MKKSYDNDLEFITRHTCHISRKSYLRQCRISSMYQGKNAVVIELYTYPISTWGGGVLNFGSDTDTRTATQNQGSFSERLKFSKKGVIQ